MNSLRILPCLTIFSEDELSAVGHITRLKSVQKDTVLFAESGPAEFFYIVNKGSVKLFKTSEEGRELIVRIMGPGDYFCCAPIFTSGKYLVGAITLENSTLIAISAEDFKKILKNELTEKGWKMISGLCNKIQYLSSLLENVTFRDVEERVILSLLRMAEEKSPGGNTVPLTITHQEIASMTGTVREVVSRAMSRLKKEGVIIDSNVRGFTVDKGKLLKLPLRRSS